ncbi:MAG: LpqB family beta-propeller domain-containing protein [Anaerolineae bacterium]
MSDTFRIFISYAKVDTRDLAFRLRDTFNAQPDVRAWMDQSLESGEDWAVQIQDEIDNADLVVVLLSPDVNRSAADPKGRSFVLKEIHYAQQAGKSIIPVLARPTRIPVQLAGIEYIDFTKDVDAGINRLLLQIARRTGNPPTAVGTRPASSTASEPSVQPSLLRRLRLNEPWAIIVAALITGLFAVLAAQIASQPAPTPTSPPTSAPINTPLANPTGTEIVFLDITATQLMLQRTVIAKQATNNALATENAQLAASATLTPSSTPTPGPPTDTAIPPSAVPTASVTGLANVTSNPVIFISNRNGTNNIYSMGMDGSNVKQLTYSGRDIDSPKWSPNGSQIVYVTDVDGNKDIFVMNADGTNSVRLTTTAGDDDLPAWSPDGTKIAFVSYRDGNGEIYIMNADGGNPTRLTTSPGDDIAPSWSPDGNRIVFSSGQDGAIHVMNADGSNLGQLTNSAGTDDFPAWSPDGTKIAFVSYRDGNHEIYIMNVDGSDQRNLTNNYGGDGNPTWSPEGTLIFFTSNRDSNANYEIYVMNADGSNPRNLTNNPSYDTSPSARIGTANVASTPISSAEIAVVSNNSGPAFAYTCSGTTFSPSNAQIISSVYSDHSNTSRRLDGIMTGKLVYVVERYQQEREIWIQISDETGQDLGWLQAIYVPACQ